MQRAIRCCPWDFKSLLEHRCSVFSLGQTLLRPTELLKHSRRKDSQKTHNIHSSMDSETNTEKKQTNWVTPQYLDLDASASLNKPIDIPVTGTLPEWLKGSLYRNGSGLYKLGGMSWNHAFDGFAVLHRWTIQNGKVSYLSMILDSDHYEKCVKHNRLVGAGFGTSFPDPCKSIFRRYFSYFIPQPPPTSDNTAVSIVEFGDRLFALTETTLINEIDPNTLLKKEQINMRSILALHMGTAHPHMEKDGTMYYYGTNMKYSKAYNFVRIPPSSKSGTPFEGAEIIGVIPSRWKMNISYTHSFGMTEHYFIHLEQPFVINLPKLMTQGSRSDSFAGSINCFTDCSIRIHIISKGTGERVPINFKAPFGFVFHFVNCYEDSGFVVCDVALYDHGDVIHDLSLEKLGSEEFHSVPEAHFVRFVLPLSLKGAEAGKNLVTLHETTATAIIRAGNSNVVDVTYDKMFREHMFELPRINYDFNGKKYKYAYGSTVYRRDNAMITKLDMVEKTFKIWKADETHVTGEPVFVPRPESVKEDDGVVLCPILAKTTEHSSFLVVLDAASFTELARATVPADVKMNLSFHGTFSERVFQTGGNSTD